MTGDINADLIAAAPGLLALVVVPWPSGGWVARIPWRAGGYPGGIWLDDYGPSIGYWFEGHPQAERAAIEAGDWALARRRAGRRR